MASLKKFEQALRDGTIRKTPDNEVAVLDVIQALTGRDYEKAKQTYKWIRKNHFELVAFTYTYSFGVGRPSSVMTAEGIMQLIMVMPTPQAGKFRQYAARLICRYLSADITLADEILEANKDNPAAMDWTNARQRGRQARRTFTDSIQAHGGRGSIYSQTTNINYRAVTGKTAKEIQSERQIKTTRDGLSIMELSATAFLESLEAEKMDVRNAKGNHEILQVVDETATDVGQIIHKHRRKEVVAEATIL